MEASKAFVLQDNDEKPLEMEDVLDQGIQDLPMYISVDGRIHWPQWPPWREYKDWKLMEKKRDDDDDDWKRKKRSNVRTYRSVGPSH